MQNPAPAPRLPIEPESRPFYQPPSRLGCSGVALVSLVTVAAFLLLFAIAAWYAWTAWRDRAGAPAPAA